MGNKPIVLGDYLPDEVEGGSDRSAKPAVAPDSRPANASTDEPEARFGGSLPGYQERGKDEPSGSEKKTAWQKLRKTALEWLQEMGIG